MILLFVHSENIKLLFKTKFNKCAANILNFLSTADQKIKAWSVESMHGVPQGDSTHTHTHVERERKATPGDVAFWHGLSTSLSLHLPCIIWLLQKSPFSLFL